MGGLEPVLVFPLSNIKITFLFSLYSVCILMEGVESFMIIVPFRLYREQVYRLLDKDYFLKEATTMQYNYFFMKQGIHVCLKLGPKITEEGKNMWKKRNFVVDSFGVRTLVPVN